ncbi:Oligosaccharyltransferase 48 kDa subunit beta-domain-containing protein [Suillus lakei]|nr:Oligosaccharyltransferase 48 kDa subunit beta-domain-containing protein [Suillus lakei]
MLIPILRAPAESFAADPTSDADTVVAASEKGGEGLWAGSQMGLVTGFQTNVNLRVVFAGGVKMFSDEYARKTFPDGGYAGNALLARDVAMWVFREKMTLRIDGVGHHRVNESAAPEMYTTNDEIVYTAHISAYDSKTSTWMPYSDIDDLQLEFTMLDPHIRTSLPAVPGFPGTSQVQFRAPDRHDVFKFVLNWKRKGYSYLESSMTVPVVSPRHDQYPRFLSAAWPYYAGAISTSVGFFLFAALWLAGDVEGERKKLKYWVCFQFSFFVHLNTLDKFQSLSSTTDTLAIEDTLTSGLDTANKLRRMAQDRSLNNVPTWL